MSEDHLDELVNDPIGSVQRWAMGSVQAKLNSIEYRLAEQSTEAKRQRVMTVLDADPELAGKWRTINNDTAFLSWLDEIDGLSGAPRLHLLQRAYNVGNPGPVCAIFKAFIASRIPARERTRERLPHEGTGPHPSIRAQDVISGKVWSAKDINNFYDDCRRGRYDKREVERLQIENEIFKAAQQGRMAVDAVQPRDAKGPLF